MLENSIYSVISPEGCASILWRDPSKSLEAAEAMKLTAKDLLNLGIIDQVISEPLGGAHRDPESIAIDIKNSIIKNLNSFKNFSREEVFQYSDIILKVNELSLDEINSIKDKTILIK